MVAGDKLFKNATEVIGEREGGGDICGTTLNFRIHKTGRNLKYQENRKKYLHFNKGS